MEQLERIEEELEAGTRSYVLPFRAVQGGGRYGVVDATGCVVSLDRQKQAYFFAVAPTRLRELVASVEGALGLHKPIAAAMYTSRSQYRGVQVCTGCGQDDGNWQRWPCPTVKAITKALGGPA